MHCETAMSETGDGSTGFDQAQFQKVMQKYRGLSKATAEKLALREMGIDVTTPRQTTSVTDSDMDGYPDRMTASDINNLMRLYGQLGSGQYGQ